MAESRQPPDAAVMSATGLRRLWAEVRPHAIEPGTVGDFVALQIRVGPEEAARALPDVAAHGVDTCPTCSEVARDVRAFLGADAPLHQPPAAVTEGTALLAEVPLFADLPDEERRRLGRLLRYRRYTRGEVIFLEGDEGTALGLIAEGRIRVQLTGSDGREVVIDTYGPGEVIGELALLDGEPRSADAIAQDASRVFWLQRADFEAFLDSHPRAAMTMMASLTRRLRHTTRVVQDATFRDVPGRLARVLLDLAARGGQPVVPGTRIESRLTQGELAAMVGASRETVNRALRGFEQRGVIGWDANRITILQPDQLRTRTEHAERV